MPPSLRTAYSHAHIAPSPTYPNAAKARGLRPAYVSSTAGAFLSYNSCLLPPPRPTPPGPDPFTSPLDILYPPPSLSSRLPTLASSHTQIRVPTPRAHAALITRPTPSPPASHSVALEQSHPHPITPFLDSLRIHELLHCCGSTTRAPKLHDSGSATESRTLSLLLPTPFARLYLPPTYLSRILRRAELPPPPPSHPPLPASWQFWPSEPRTGIDSACSASPSAFAHRTHPRADDSFPGFHSPCRGLTQALHSGSSQPGLESDSRHYGSPPPARFL